MQKTILSLILFAIGLEAQQTLYAVRPVAGTAYPTPGSSSSAPRESAKDAFLQGPLSIAAVDGGLLVSGNINASVSNQVLSVTPDGLLSPLTPVSAAFSPYRVVADGSGGAIIHDGSNIYRPSSEGLQRATGFSQLGFNTNMVAAGLNGDLYIANNQTTLGARPKIYLRRRDGSVIFLGGAQDSSGSNLIDYYGPAIGASIRFLDGLSFDHTSRVLFLNQGSIIKAIDANQFISWFAGNPFDFVGSGRILASLATSSGIYAPNAGFASGRVKIAAYQGVLFVADGCRIYRITPDWLLRPYAGGECGFTGDGVTAAQARFGPIGNLAVSPEGLYVADGNQVKLIALDGKVSTIVGASHYGGDGGPATAARMDRPEAILFNAARNLIIADNGNGRLRSLQTDGSIRNFGGTSLLISSMALDSDGSVVGVNSGGQVVRIATNGAVTPIASLLFAFGVAIDSARNIYASAQAQIQKISPAGTVTAFASDDGQGYLAFDRQGMLLHLRRNGEIRKYAVDGKFTVLANAPPFGQLQFENDSTILVGSLFSVGGIYRTTIGGTLATQRISSMKATGVAPGTNGDFYASYGDQVWRFFPDTVDKFDVSQGALQTGANNTYFYRVRTTVLGKSGFPMNRVPVEYQVVKGAARVSWARIEAIGSNNTVIPDFTTDFQGVSEILVGVDDPAEEVRLQVAVPGLASSSVLVQASAEPVGPIDLVDPVATPLAIVTIRGGPFVPNGLDVSAPAAAAVLPNSLAGVCVWFGGNLAGMKRVTANAIDVQVPDLPPGEATVSIVSKCTKPEETTGPGYKVMVLVSAPQFVTWVVRDSGNRVVLAEDTETGRPIGEPGSRVGAAMLPAQPGRVIDMFATGLGSSSVAAPLVRIGGVIAPVISIQSESPGRHRIRLRIPASVADGYAPATLEGDAGGGQPSAFLYIRTDR